MATWHISSFDSDGNLHINNIFFDKHCHELGRMAMYYLVLKARNTPYKNRKQIREVLGINVTTEWRWRNELKRVGLL